MYSRILNCDYEFVSPWWDEVSLNAKDLVSSSTASVFIFHLTLMPIELVKWQVTVCVLMFLVLKCLYGMKNVSTLTTMVLLQVSKLIVLDPRKRLSVREALQHPWVLGKAARFSHMDTTQRKLQEFNARRKLKVRHSSTGSSVSHAFIAKHPGTNVTVQYEHSDK